MTIERGLVLPNIVYRSALPDEAELLTDIAIRSKCYWGYSEAFMKQCATELTITPHDLCEKNNNAIVAESGKQVPGFYVLTNLSPTDVDLDCLYVDPAYIGQGIGGSLLQHAVNLAKQLGARSLEIQADPHAEAFYLKSGAIRIGEKESGSIPGRMLPLLQITL